MTTTWPWYFSGARFAWVRGTAGGPLPSGAVVTAAGFSSGLGRTAADPAPWPATFPFAPASASLVAVVCGGRTLGGGTGLLGAGGAAGGFASGGRAGVGAGGG